MKFKNYVPRLSVILIAVSLLGVSAISRCPFPVAGKAPQQNPVKVASVHFDATR